MKDLFERIVKDKGPLGKWAKQAEGYYVFPKLEGPISNRMIFNGNYSTCFLCTLNNTFAVNWFQGWEMQQAGIYVFTLRTYTIAKDKFVFLQRQINCDFEMFIRSFCCLLVIADIIYSAFLFFQETLYCGNLGIIICIIFSLCEIREGRFI